MVNEFHKISDSAERRSFLQSCYTIVRSFSATEKLIFSSLVVIAVISGLMLLSRLNSKFLVAIPDYGGSVSEGIVGVPRFVNPVLAISDADKDLTTLVFSGLLKATPEDALIGDLAKEYKISDDGRTYTFTLKDDVVFHDGESVTTDDIEFTIQRIQDPTIKSPLRSVWDGVIVQKIDSRTISFTLKQAYAPFLNNFTLGIIPRHIWKDIPSDEFSFSEFNMSAIGSGPYEIRNVKLNSHSLPTLYSLRSFNSYILGRPFVKNLDLHFYQNENDLIKAFKGGDIESMSGISPENLSGVDTEDSTIITTTLPRVFGVFFNQNQSAVFLNKEVREALSVAVDKDRVVDDVLMGYAETISSPVPSSHTLMAATSTQSRVDRALGILTKAGWTLNTQTGIMEKKINNVVVPLSFTLATGDAVELKRTAELIKEDWEKIGASVDLKVFEIGDLNQNVIRPRKFDALLFGEVVGREYDLYPFWHSSQRNDPGLNIALYANISADRILETLRLTQNRDERKKKAVEFENLFKSDMPAVFVYSPHFIYVVPEKLQNVALGEILYPGERFLNVYKWHIESNNVWKIFAQ